MTNEFDLSYGVLKSLKENNLSVEHSVNDTFTVVFNGTKPIALIQDVTRAELPVFLNGFAAGMRVADICTN